MSPGGRRRAVTVLDVPKAPPDLGPGRGAPVPPGRGHLRARNRLRNAVGTRVGVERVHVPAALAIPEWVQVAELAPSPVEVVQQPAGDLARSRRRPSAG